MWETISDNRRRFNRERCNETILLDFCDCKKKKIYNDSSVTGKIIDFSLHGACLFPDKIQYGCQHVFESTQHHNDYIIRLEYIQYDKNKPLVVYGNSAWYNQYAWYNQSSFDNPASIQFKLGIKFLKEQDPDILKSFYVKLATRQKVKEGRLKKLFRLL